MNDFQKECMFKLQDMSCGVIPMDKDLFNKLWAMKCRLETEGKY